MQTTTTQATTTTTEAFPAADALDLFELPALDAPRSIYTGVTMAGGYVPDNAVVFEGSGRITYILDGLYERLEIRAGVPNTETDYTYVYIYGDGETLWEYDRIDIGDGVVDVTLDVTGITQLELSHSDNLIGANPTAVFADGYVWTAQQVIQPDADFVSTVCPTDPQSVFALESIGEAPDVATDMLMANSYRPATAIRFDGSGRATYLLNAQYDRLAIRVGVPNTATDYTYVYVYGDGETLWEYDRIDIADGVVDVALDVSGITQLELSHSDNLIGATPSAVFADAFVCTG
jgi:hypothetical protein